jgi:hypothetical protein
MLFHLSFKVGLQCTDICQNKILLTDFIVRYTKGRAIAQAFSRRILIDEARARSQCNPYGICGGQNYTGSGFSQKPSVSPVSIIPLIIHIHSCIIWGMDNVSVSGHSATEHSLTPSQQ